MTTTPQMDDDDAYEDAQDLVALNRREPCDGCGKTIARVGRHVLADVEDPCRCMDGVCAQCGAKAVPPGVPGDTPVCEPCAIDLGMIEPHAHCLLCDSGMEPPDADDPLVCEHCQDEFDWKKASRALVVAVERLMDATPRIDTEAWLPALSAVTMTVGAIEIYAATENPDVLASAIRYAETPLSEFLTGERLALGAGRSLFDLYHEMKEQLAAFPAASWTTQLTMCLLCRATCETDPEGGYPKCPDCVTGARFWKFLLQTEDLYVYFIGYGREREALGQVTDWQNAQEEAWSLDGTDAPHPGEAYATFDEAMDAVPYNNDPVAWGEAVDLEAGPISCGDADDPHWFSAAMWAQICGVCPHCRAWGAQ